ncbi:hexose transporter [Hysterangium stoloniferum]|nr:hexose transporter [Hysterangium stoloniferum]
MPDQISGNGIIGDEQGNGQAGHDQKPTYSSLVNDPEINPWYTQKRRVLLNLYIGMLLLANFADGYDGSMMNGLQSLNQWKEAFNYPHGSKLALLTVIQRVGGIAMLPILPYLADGMGRRFTVFTGATIMTVGAIIQACSQNVETFIAARFLMKRLKVGCGSAFATNAAQMLITEIAYPTQRAVLTSSFSALWQGGAVLAAWTTFVSFRLQNSWAWRIPSAVQAFPALIQMIFAFLGPESPRWLVDRGRGAEALTCLAYYHARGDEQDPLVQYEFREIKTAIKLDGSVGWRGLTATRGNRRRIMVIVALAFFSQWSGNGLVAYYLAPVFETIGITDTFTQLLVNGLLSVENVLIAVGAACLCDKIGRRTLFITSTAGMLITFTLQTVFSALYAQGGGIAMAHTVIAFICTSYSMPFMMRVSRFSHISTESDLSTIRSHIPPWLEREFPNDDTLSSPLKSHESRIFSYTVEIMPYALRAKGLTVFYFAISLSFIFNQYINPIALERLQWKYYIVFCVWLVFELIFVSLFVVETKGRTLEETAAIFDGEDKVKAIATNTFLSDR